MSVPDAPTGPHLGCTFAPRSGPLTESPPSPGPIWAALEDAMAAPFCKHTQKANPSLISTAVKTDHNVVANPALSSLVLNIT